MSSLRKVNYFEDFLRFQHFTLPSSTVVMNIENELPIILFFFSFVSLFPQQRGRNRMGHPPHQRLE